MSINSALFTGVSGLFAQSNAIGAISDNIANSNTVGYKRAVTPFSTLVTTQATSTSFSPGGVRTSPGINSAQQGLLQSTTNTTDLAISGNGMFIVNTQAETDPQTGSGATLFTRAGQFQPDEDGFLRNTAGYYLQGFRLGPDGEPVNGDPAPNSLDNLETIRIEQNRIEGAPSTELDFRANLPSEVTNPGGVRTLTSSFVQGFDFDGNQGGTRFYNVTVRSPIGQDNTLTFEAAENPDDTRLVLGGNNLLTPSLNTLDVTAFEFNLQIAGQQVGGDLTAAPPEATVQAQPPGTTIPQIAEILEDEIQALGVGFQEVTVRATPQGQLEIFDPTGRTIDLQIGATGQLLPGPPVGYAAGQLSNLSPSSPSFGVESAARLTGAVGLSGGNPVTLTIGGIAVGPTGTSTSAAGTPPDVVRANFETIVSELQTGIDGNAALAGYQLTISGNDLIVRDAFGREVPVEITDGTAINSNTAIEPTPSLSDILPSNNLNVALSIGGIDVDTRGISSVTSSRDLITRLTSAIDRSEIDVSTIRLETDAQNRLVIIDDFGRQIDFSISSETQVVSDEFVDGSSSVFPGDFSASLLRVGDVDVDFAGLTGATSIINLASDIQGRVNSAGLTGVTVTASSEENTLRIVDEQGRSIQFDLQASEPARAAPTAPPGDVNIAGNTTTISNFPEAFGFSFFQSPRDLSSSVISFTDTTGVGRDITNGNTNFASVSSATDFANQLTAAAVALGFTGFQASISGDDLVIDGSNLTSGAPFDDITNLLFAFGVAESSLGPDLVPANNEVAAGANYSVSIAEDVTALQDGQFVAGGTAFGSDTTGPAEEVSPLDAARNLEDAILQGLRDLALEQNIAAPTDIGISVATNANGVATLAISDASEVGGFRLVSADTLDAAGQFLEAAEIGFFNDIENVDPITTPLEYFDNLGNPRLLDLTFTPQGEPGLWQLTVANREDRVNGIVGSLLIQFSSEEPNIGAIDTVSFPQGSPPATLLNANGVEITDPETLNAGDPLRLLLSLDNGVDTADGPEPQEQSMILDLGFIGDREGITQFAGDFTPTEIRRDGFAVGNFDRVEVGQDGTVNAVFDNGQIIPIFQVPLVNFTNVNGLSAVSGNAFQQTLDSGDFTVGTAGSGPFGTIDGSTLEQSTVDIAEEFTNLIVAQRAYSSNARVITTADELLQETTNLIR